MRLVILASLLVAMVLRILPLPRELFVYNPDWVLLFLIYWSMAIPERMGVGIAWCAGLFSDALSGRMLGQHALAYAVVVFVCVKWHRRLRLYPVYQQMILILPLLLLDQLLIFWTQNIKAGGQIGTSYWLPSVTGAMAWLAVHPTLRRLRRHYQAA